MSYGSSHRFLLQSVASRGVQSVSDSIKMFKKEYPDINEHKIEEMVKEINIKLNPFNQEIKIVDEETTLQKLLVFISTGNDDATKSQNMFKESQLKYFRSLLEIIMNSRNGQIDEIQARNATGGSFPQIEAENMLITLCRMFYLEKFEDNYMLGIRAIHEFDPYFRHNMPHLIRICSFCKQLVFKGHLCSSCEETVHTKCLKTYSSNHRKWPCCQKQFHESEMFPSDDHDMTQTGRSRQSRQRNSRNETVDLTQQDIERVSSLEISQSRKRKRT